MGIAPDALQAIGSESQGVTSSEYQILKELQDRIDKSTVSPIFTGQQAKAGTTATEITELQRQARLTLGLTITSASLMEKKLAYLRLWNILENWFEPIGTRVVELEGAKKLIKTFRTANRETNIEGEGLGERQVIPTEGELPSAKEIRAMERAEEKTRRMPIRKIFLNGKDLKNAGLIWYVNIIAKEKRSSATEKLLFREKLNDLLSLAQIGSRPSVDGLEEEFSRIWATPRGRAFQRGMAAVPELGGAEAPLKGRSNQGGVPSNLPVGVAAEI
jgi:hypothetical protein